jgi:catechol 2,3-dioxygenase-like lactoylglutathione lyase family enzyme
MPHHLKKLSPNIIVADVSRSIAFYRDVLGFSLEQTVPDGEPFVFAIMKSGDVPIYLNAPGPAVEEYPALKDRPLGGTLTLFINVDDVRGSYAQLEDRAGRHATREKVYGDRVRVPRSGQLHHHLRAI